MPGKLVILYEWIQSKRAPDNTAIGLDTDLIENRLIDSIDFAEFLFMLEEISGKDIDISEVELDSFRTLRSIQSTFLQGG